MTDKITKPDRTGPWQQGMLITDDTAHEIWQEIDQEELTMDENWILNTLRDLDNILYGLSIGQDTV